MRSPSVRSLLLLVGALLFIAAPLQAQDTGRITGTIVADGTNRPLSGAQVFLEGTRVGALANAAGRFLLLNVPAGTHTIRVDLIGFTQESQSVTVAAGGSATADFVLTETAISLDEIVVTGTAAEVRAKEIANSLDAVTSRDIEVQPVTSTENILGGRVPGVTVMGGGGQPGAGSTIKVRGTNTVSSTTEPLIYVDGIRIHNLPRAAGGGARVGISPLQSINPKDIERIEVVKGASATTLYGTEASGGVIQIFTKRGVSGEPIWNAEVGLGLSAMGHIGPADDPQEIYMNCGDVDQLYGLDVFNSDETQRANKIFIQDPTCPSDGSWDEGGNEQRYNMSVRGGLGDITYFVSGNYNDAKGTLPTQGAKDGGVRANIDFSPIQDLRFALNTAYSRMEAQFVPDGNNANGTLLNVGRAHNNYLKGGKGDECAAIVASGKTCVTNGYIFEDKDQSTRVDNFTLGFSTFYNPTESLSNRLAIGFDYNDFAFRSSRSFGNLSSPDGFLTDQQSNHTKLSVDYTGSLRNNFDFMGGVQSTLSWGGQLFRDRDRQTNIAVESFAGPGFPTIATGSTLTGRTDDQFTITSAGAFLQEVLGFKDRLFITAGLRVDGNSAFGDDYGLQYYPKVSASYVISDHDAWPSDWFETLKLRSALGQSGKAPRPFAKLRTWSPVAGFTAPGFTPGEIGNSDVGPERTNELEMGFDASLFQGRVGLELTYFQATTTDALVPVTYPPSQGFLNTREENIGEVYNSGIEIQASLGVLRSDNIDWRLRGNISLLDSEVKALGGEEIFADNKAEFREGFPAPGYFGRKVMNAGEIGQAPEVETNQFLGPVFPTELIGMGTTITLFNRVTLDALAEYQGGHFLPNYTGYQNERRGAWRPCFGIQEKIIEAEHGGNPNALADVDPLDRAKCGITGSGLSPDSDFWVEAADFVKLRQVALTWEIPENLINFADRASVTVAGRNLWISTDYNGSDPEVEDFRDRDEGTYDGNGDYGRRDYYTLPAPRSFLLSFRVTF